MNKYKSKSMEAKDMMVQAMSQLREACLEADKEQEYTDAFCIERAMRYLREALEYVEAVEYREDEEDA